MDAPDRGALRGEVDAMTRIDCGPGAAHRHPTLARLTA